MINNYKIRLIKHNKILLLISFTFNFLALGYVQFEATFIIFRILKFHNVRYVH